jgi:hypothetical protein
VEAWLFYLLFVSKQPVCAKTPDTSTSVNSYIFIMFPGHYNFYLSI